VKRSITLIGLIAVHFNSYEYFYKANNHQHLWLKSIRSFLAFWEYLTSYQHPL